MSRPKQKFLSLNFFKEKATYHTRAQKELTGWQILQKIQSGQFIHFAQRRVAFHHGYMLPRQNLLVRQLSLSPSLVFLPAEPEDIGTLQDSLTKYLQGQGCGREKLIFATQL